MSRFVDATTDEQLDVPEATRRLGEIRRSDDDFLARAATVLVGLYNNRTLLRQILFASLRQLSSDAGSAFYSPQSFLISSGKLACESDTFTLRGNIWFPPTLVGVNQHLEDSVYSYGNCHDHNFEFLTVGYSGPGYATDIYEYDHDQVTGVVGEAVDLRFTQRAVLGPGQVLHFRKSKDIHVQLHPERTSISINILLSEKDLKVRPQYEFDLDTGRIASVLYSSSMFDVSMTQMIGQLGCHDVLQTVRTEMLDSPMWLHRHAALQALVDAGELGRADAVIKARDILPAAAAAALWGAA